MSAESAAVVRLSQPAAIKKRTETSTASDAIKQPASTTRPHATLAGITDVVHRDGRFKSSAVLLSEETGLEPRISDTEQLAEALDSATKSVDALIAQAIEITEQRCKIELQKSVDAATTSAIRSTEKRMERDREKAVKLAIAETWSEANTKEQEAVREAIRMTETRCAEEQRIAVQLATSAVNLEWGKTQEDVAAENAAKTFEQAAKAAGAALTAAQGLQKRDLKPRVAAQPDSKPAPPSDDGAALEFF